MNDIEVILRRIYHHMKGRCYNSNDNKYKNYGARGIKVCNEWINSFDSFYKWALKNGYKKGLSIDRINNDGDYEPINCKWSTPKEQANNRTTNKYYSYKGITKTIAQWSDETGINVGTLYWRIKHNYSPDEVMNKEINTKKKKLYFYNGKGLMIKEWSKAINKSETVLYHHLKKGKKFEDIMKGYGF